MRQKHGCRLAGTAGPEPALRSQSHHPSQPLRRLSQSSRSRRCPVGRQSWRTGTGHPARSLVGSYQSEWHVQSYLCRKQGGSRGVFKKCQQYWICCNTVYVKKLNIQWGICPVEHSFLVVQRQAIGRCQAAVDDGGAKVSTKCGPLNLSWTSPVSPVQVTGQKEQEWKGRWEELMYLLWRSRHPDYSNHCIYVQSVDIWW